MSHDLCSATLDKHAWYVTELGKEGGGRACSTEFSSWKQPEHALVASCRNLSTNNVGRPIPPTHTFVCKCHTQLKMPRKSTTFLAFGWSGNETNAILPSWYPTQHLFGTCYSLATCMYMYVTLNTPSI